MKVLVLVLVLCAAACAVPTKPQDDDGFLQAVTSFASLMMKTKNRTAPSAPATLNDVMVAAVAGLKDSTTVREMTRISHQMSQVMHVKDASDSSAQRRRRSLLRLFGPDKRYRPLIAAIGPTFGLAQFHVPFTKLDVLFFKDPCPSPKWG